MHKSRSALFTTLICLAPLACDDGGGGDADTGADDVDTTGDTGEGTRVASFGATGANISTGGVHSLGDVVYNGVATVDGDISGVIVTFSDDLNITDHTGITATSSATFAGAVLSETNQGHNIIISSPVTTFVGDSSGVDLVQTLEARREVTKYAGFKIWVGKMAQKMLHYLYNRLRKAIGYIPYYVPDQYEIRRLAEPYFHMRLSGGEGDMLVGKSIMSYQKKTAHMICELSPYSCMPNTMSIGAMANVQGKYPDLLYAPIEVKGDAEVHAISRCQMILTEARKRSQAEYDKVLAGLGLTEEKIRAYETKHPELRQATYRIPHYGVAGTAANYAIHIAKKLGIKNSYKESSVYGKLG